LPSQAATETGPAASKTVHDWPKCLFRAENAREAGAL
jgi:hypothetical protein